MSSSAVTKKSSDEVSQGGSMEAREQSTSANASAGLNLNLVGAVSGLFSGNSKKETQADGTATEQKSQQAGVQGAGAANMNAQVAANAQHEDHRMRVQDK